MSAHPDVSLFTALWRGFTGRCPRCGEGRMFRKFLKVVDHCPACNEALHHQRAGDAPAYLVILIVGHILVPLIVWVEVEYSPPYWLQLLVWLPVVTACAIGLLQPVKGTVVAVEWKFGLHGFGKKAQD